MKKTGWLIGTMMMVMLAELASQPSEKIPLPYRQDQLVIKWLPASDTDANLQLLKARYRDCQPKPIRKPPSSARQGSKSILDHIYLVQVPAGTDIPALCDSLSQSGSVVYAEPVYLPELLRIPDDPEAQPGGNQTYLSVINAYQAWELTTGDPGVIVGVIDTGSDPDHVDLTASYAYNLSDTVNGTDDDLNGYIDDYLGYDFADLDADPTADTDPHGTRVAGIIGATTDNQAGIAGIGYHTRIRPLKIFKSGSNLSAGSYTAIQYAADNGYDVINLSWGSTGYYSQFEQDIITYAAVEKNVVVVAAAGNTPEDVLFFPASYDHVLSVAAANEDDTKASFGTYNAAVDLMAPGVGIYSTENNDSYGADNGSSYAAPMVSGVAALMRALHPEWSATEIANRIKASADPVYDIPENQPYLGKLGTGRLNAYRALSAGSAISLEVMVDSTFFPFDSPYFGDTVMIYVQVTNQLDPVYLLESKLVGNSPYTHPLDTFHYIGYMDSGDTRTIGPFSFVVDTQAPAGTPLPVAIKLTEGNHFSSYHAIDFRTGDEYFDMANDSISLTVTASGRLGFNADLYYDGTGLRYDGLLAKNIGFFARINDSLLLDYIPTIPAYGTADQDFEALSTLRPYLQNPDAQFSFGTFADTIGRIFIENYTVIWDSLPGKAIGLIYRLSNRSADTLVNVRPGLFADLDVNEPDANRSVNLGDSIVLVSDTLGRYAAIALAAGPGFCGMADEAGLADTLSDADKIALLSTTTTDSLGFDDNKNVVVFAGMTKGVLPPGEAMTLQVILATGDSLAQVQWEIDQAITRLSDFRLNPPTDTVLYSCEGGVVYLVPVPGNDHYFFADPLGQDTLAVNDTLFIESLTHDTIFYASRIRDGYSETIRAYPIRTLVNVADFRFETDTFFLGDNPANQVRITDLSFEPINWTWDFGNGLQASGIQHPLPVYDAPGTYPVTLTVQNTQGCTDQITRILTVLERPSPPQLGPYGFCPGTSVTITSGDTLRYYPFSDSREPLTEGVEFTLESPMQDTIIYVSRVKNGLESHKSVLEFIENPTSLTLSIHPYTDSLSGYWAEVNILESYVAAANWTLDSTIVSDSLTALFEVAADTITLHYQAITDSACEVIGSETILPSPSPLPMADDQSVCAGGDVILTPANGTIFGYYADSLLSIPLHKGESWTYDSLVSDTTVYIVGLDSLLPGEIVPVDLTALDYRFDILADPDTLYLNLNRSVDFSLSMASETVTWYVDSVFETVSVTPTLFFNEPGQYQILAEGVHEIGCTYADTLTITVLETYIEPLSLSDTSVKIFPVPASGYLYWETSRRFPLRSVTASDLTGKTYNLSFDNEKIDLAPLPAGWFILHIESLAGKIITLKGIKQSK